MKATEGQAIEAASRRTTLLDISEDKWARQFLDGIRSRWDQEWKGESGNDEHQEAEIQIAEAMEALVAHEYYLAGDLDQDPLRSIVSRILSIKLGTGVTYKCTDIWPVINAIHCDGLRSKKWHTLYLIALRVYQPVMSEDHQAKVSRWRTDVVASINDGEATYIRDDFYDRLLGLLFPEMQLALDMSFGTIQQPKGRKGPVAVQEPGKGLPKVDHRDAFLSGKALEEWKRANPVAAEAWMQSPAGARINR